MGEPQDLTSFPEETEAFRNENETDIVQAVVRGRRFRFFVPRSLDRFVDEHDPFLGFPLWSKIWEASLILADELAGLKVEPAKSFLELGSGIGLVGVVAASFGHQITMSEHDPHALAFARANALLNGSSNARVLAMDWNDPGISSRFDYIVGSEVIYHERDFEPLKRLFEKFLKPGGEVILCAEPRETNMAFLSLMQEYYVVKAWRKRLRSEEKNISVILCRMSLKEQRPVIREAR